MTRDSITRPTTLLSFVLGAWRSINLRVRELLAGLRTIRCDECLGVIRWWNRRVWLVKGERCAHLRCWQGRLFFKALVADEIRRSQIMAGEIRPPPEGSSEPGDDGAGDELRAPYETAPRASREPGERLEGQAHQVEQPPTETGLNKHTRGNMSLRKLRQSLGEIFHRAAQHRTPAAPRPPQLCMLCGWVEFNATSGFCSKCGTSLRP
jgi:hypothetical protein